MGLRVGIKRSTVAFSACLLTLAALTIGCQQAAASWVVSTEPNTLAITGNGSAEDLEVKEIRVPGTSLIEIEIAGISDSRIAASAGSCRYQTADKYSAGSVRCRIGFQNLRVAAGGGDDHVVIGEAIFSAVDVDGGDGDDSIDLDVTRGGATIHGGSGNDRLSNSNFQGHTYGDDGEDTLLAPLSLMLPSRDPSPREGAHLYGGSGDDNVRGSFYRDEIYGDEGHDTIFADGIANAFQAGECFRFSDRFPIWGPTTVVRLFTDPMFHQLLVQLGIDSVQELIDNWRVQFCLPGVSSNLTSSLRQDLDNEDLHSDFIVGSNDLVYGGPGSDQVHSGEGDDEVFGGDGPDQIDGGFGNDRLSGEGDVDTLSGGANADHLDGGYGTDNLSGGSGNDELNGANGDDYLLGGGGNDSLFGGASNDELHGESGDDTFEDGPGRDAMFGGIGADTVSYARSKLGVQVSSNDEWDDGFASQDYVSQIENIIGSQFDDTLTGGPGANFIDGLRGNDSIEVSGDNKTLPDTVACGDDYDQVARDATDMIDEDCEGIF